MYQVPCHIQCVSCTKHSVPGRLHKLSPHLQERAFFIGQCDAMQCSAMQCNAAQCHAVSTCQDALLQRAVSHKCHAKLLALLQQPRRLWFVFKHIVLHLHQDSGHCNTFTSSYTHIMTSDIHIIIHSHHHVLHPVRFLVRSFQ